MSNTTSSCSSRKHHRLQRRWWWLCRDLVTAAVVGGGGGGSSSSGTDSSRCCCCSNSTTKQQQQQHRRQVVLQRPIVILVLVLMVVAVVNNNSNYYTGKIIIPSTTISSLLVSSSSSSSDNAVVTTNDSVFITKRSEKQVTTSTLIDKVLLQNDGEEAKPAVQNDGEEPNKRPNQPNHLVPIVLDPSEIHYLQPSSVEEEWSKVKVLVYITTHLADYHTLFLPCWNDAIQRLSIFRYADILLYTAETPSNDILQMLHRPLPRKTIVKLYDNTGYTEGAVQAMIDPFIRALQQEDKDQQQHHSPRTTKSSSSSSWFDGYDWVIRMNLDVLIKNDEWLVKTMLNPNIDGIFKECFNNKQWDNIHSDFNIFRPKALDPNAFLNMNENEPYNAEGHLTRGFLNIYQSGRAMFIEGADNEAPGICRMGGNVLHLHAVSQSCPYYYNFTK